MWRLPHSEQPHPALLCSRCSIFLSSVPSALNCPTSGSRASRGSGTSHVLQSVRNVPFWCPWCPQEAGPAPCSPALTVKARGALAVHTTQPALSSFSRIRPSPSSPVQRPLLISSFPPRCETKQPTPAYPAGPVPAASFRGLSVIIGSGGSRAPSNPGQAAWMDNRGWPPAWPLLTAKGPTRP